MGLLEVLGKVTGKVHFYIFIGNSPAVEVKLNNKEIVLDVKNPILAAELALKEFLEKKDVSIKWVEKIKRMGYTIKIKHGALELEL
jgi:hypothetical protein